MQNWVVYLIKCSDNTYYCGSTNNINRRIKEHNDGVGSKYTRSRTPVELIALCEGMNKSEAYKLEYQVKRKPKKDKIKFLNNIKNQQK